MVDKTGRNGASYFSSSTIGLHARYQSIKNNEFHALKLVEETYFIPHADKYLIYAPLQKTVVLVNPSAIELLKHFQVGRFHKCQAHKDFFNHLSEAGIIIGKNEKVPFQ